MRSGDMTEADSTMTGTRTGTGTDELVFFVNGKKVKKKNTGVKFKNEIIKININAVLLFTGTVHLKLYRLSIDL